MLRTLGLCASLVGVAGCFSEPDVVGMGDDGGSSSGTSSNSTGSEPSTSGGVEPTTGSTGEGSSGQDSDSTGQGCVPGQLGCACDPSGGCNGGGPCIDDVCVPPPFDCVVTYGGSEDELQVQVTRVFEDGRLEDAGRETVEAIHAVNDDVAGQDMLVACGGSIHAVAEGSHAIRTFTLEPDGSPTASAETEVAGAVLRALECVRPSEDFLLAFSSEFGPTGATVLATVLGVEPNGELTPGGVPTALPDLGSGSIPRRIRSAWKGEVSTAFVTYDDVGLNFSRLVSVQLNATTGAVTFPATETIVTGIQAQLGGLTYARSDDALVLTGGQTGDPAGLGNLIRMDVNDAVADLAFVQVVDDATDVFFAASSSVAIANVQPWPEHALVGSDGRFGFVSVGDGFAPTLVHEQTFEGSGKSTALTAHGDSVVVVVDGVRVHAFQANSLQGASVESTEMPHGVDGYTTSIVVPCDGPG